MLSVKGLTKRYPNTEISAIEDITLDFPDGQVIAIIGPSGAGKSTLIRCINRLVEPTSGEIWLNETNVCNLKSESLRKLRCRIGMIFQEYALVDRLTVMENVLSGKLGSVSLWKSVRRKFPQPVVKSAFEILDRVGLLDQVDKRADELSGGQRQRVGIARALLQQPELLLVDEPTASLDPKTARQIMRLIVGLSKEYNLTAIINIHDVVLAREFTQRIIGLRDGSVVYDASPAGLGTETLGAIYGEEDWSHSTYESDNNDSDSAAASIDEKLGALK